MYQGLGSETVTTQFITDPNYVPPDPLMDDYLAVLASGQAGGYDTGAPATGQHGTTIKDWLQQNKTMVYAGAGILVLMSMMKGRR